MILHQDIIPVKIWQEINIYPKIYVVQGSPLKVADLQACTIGKAAACIILNSSKEGDKNSFMNDADTILIYKIIKSLKPDILISTEIASFSSLNFLNISKNNLSQR